MAKRKKTGGRKKGTPDKDRGRKNRRVLTDDAADAFIAVAWECYGNLLDIATRFKLRRDAVVTYLERHPELKPIVKQARESVLDIGESSLTKATKKGVGWATKFLLETRGKKRGYIKQLQLTGGDPTEGALPIQIIMPHNNRERLPSQLRGITDANDSATDTATGSGADGEATGTAAESSNQGNNPEPDAGAATGATDADTGI